FASDDECFCFRHRRLLGRCASEGTFQAVSVTPQSAAVRGQGQVKERESELKEARRFITYRLSAPPGNWPLVDVAGAASSPARLSALVRPLSFDSDGAALERRPLFPLSLQSPLIPLVPVLWQACRIRVATSRPSFQLPPLRCRVTASRCASTPRPLR